MARKDNKGRNLKVGESQRSDGRYMYRYVDGRTGKRVTIYDTDLAALREKERQIARDQEDGLVTDQGVKKLTVNALFERYMQAQELAESTRTNYLATWKNHVQDTIGPMRVIQVRPSHIQTFYAGLSKEGYAHNTIKLIHTLLYPSFEMAVDDDIIRKNPAKDTLKDYGKPAEERVALTVAQQEKLLAFARQSRIYRKRLPMLQVMLGLSCRCGELIGLTWQDVDMERRQVSIGSQLIYKDYGDGYRFHLSAPKTAAGIRTIPMSDTVYEAFAEQKRQNFLLGIPRNVEVEGRSDYIFTSKNGRPLMPNAINNALYNLVAAYNKEETALAAKEKREAELMPSISSHNMRHTGCTRMVERNINLKAVQYVMGHANSGITMDVYTHITEQAQVEKEIAKLNRVQAV